MPTDAVEARVLDIGLPWFDQRESAVFKDLGYACVYAIGPEGSRMTTIDSTNDPVRRFAWLQASHWRKLRVHEIVWTQGPPLAKRLCGKVQDLLKPRRVRGDWFDVTPELILPAFDVAGDKTGVRGFTHSEMVRRVKDAREEALQRALARAGALT